MKIFLILFINILLANTSQLAKFITKKDYETARQYWNKVLEEKVSISLLLKISEFEMLINGREASQKLLVDYLKKFGSSLSENDKKEILKKLSELLETFFSEEGQSLYFQALEKIKANQCTSALTLLEQALSIEKGNIRILMQKIQCEKAEKNLKNLYSSLEVAYRMNPYSTEILEELIDIALYFKDFDKVLNLLDPNGGAIAIKQKVALAYVLFEKGKEQEALTILNELINKVKSLPSIIYFLKGKLLLSKNKSEEAKIFLEKFISLAETEKTTLLFDPYRLDEKIIIAKKILAKTAS